MIMYKRDEKIEDEELDWEQESSEPSAPQKEITAVKPYEPKPKKSLSNGSNDEGQFSYEPPKANALEAFFEKYEIASLAVSGLILPYIVGLLFNTTLFYVYSGVTIDMIFSVNKNPTIFELWTIGAYFFITIWLVGIILKVLFGKR